MVKFIKVTAETPCGDAKEYAFMGDLDKQADKARLIEFLLWCCDDCADFFPCPDEWDVDEWQDQTLVRWEVMETSWISVWPNGMPIM